MTGGDWIVISIVVFLLMRWYGNYRADQERNRGLTSGERTLRRLHEPS